MWLTCTLALITLPCALGQGRTPYDWQTAPYDNDAFNVRVHYADDTVLTCNDSRVAGSSYTVDKWITPELTILRPGDSLSFQTLDGLATWTASDDGMNLFINATHDRHFGIYYCLVTDDVGTEWVVKAAVNLRGASWGYGWYRYQWATIWSFVGSSICALILAVGAIVWVRVDHTPEPLPPDEDDFDTILAKLGYDNAAYDHNDDLPNGKSSANIQLREKLSYTAEDTSPTASAIVTADGKPPRPHSPASVDNDAPVPYDIVVEINGQAGSRGVSSAGPWEAGTANSAGVRARNDDDTVMQEARL